MFLFSNNPVSFVMTPGRYTALAPFTFYGYQPADPGAGFPGYGAVNKSPLILPSGPLLGVRFAYNGSTDTAELNVSPARTFFNSTTVQLWLNGSLHATLIRNFSADAYVLPVAPAANPFTEGTPVQVNLVFLA